MRSGVIPGSVQRTMWSAGDWTSALPTVLSFYLAPCSIHFCASAAVTVNNVPATPPARLYNNIQAFHVSRHMLCQLRELSSLACLISKNPIIFSIPSTINSEHSWLVSKLVCMHIYASKWIAYMFQAFLLENGRDLFHLFKSLWSHKH